MRTFNVEAREVVTTPTGNGFRACYLRLTIDDKEQIISAIPWNEGYIEDAPDPAK